MNKALLKAYAPQARLDFIAAVAAQANLLGIRAGGSSPAESRGDVAIVEGREWPASIVARRDKLIERVEHHGFDQTMEEVAYTWFNRFAALRYMEIHDYLDHGWRVLSSRDGGMPEILGHASELPLPGLSQDKARELQLAGGRENELYKMLLTAQCNELSRTMPFLFERIDDETELLLHENLLRTDSIVVKMVEEIPEENWAHIEIIGWLYQFYIGDKKDSVIGKVVATEDIPAATQLFTPNWIVKFMVQNSIGRLWLESNPSSALRSSWTYFVDDSDQPDDAKARVRELVEARAREDGGQINPETLKLLDPACGSGHILVEAYDVFKAIYLERGYRSRDIPRLILKNNLYGIDVDRRAAQLSGFALMMKARADDRRLLSEAPRLHIVELLDADQFDAARLAAGLAQHGFAVDDVRALLEVFEGAKTYGSLIEIPEWFSHSLPAIRARLEAASQSGDLYASSSGTDLLVLIEQAEVLSMQFDAVVANPPYMGNRNMNADLKAFLQSNSPDTKADIYAAFIKRGLKQVKATGLEAMVAMETWMFLSSYSEMRSTFLASATLDSMVHMPYEGKGRTSMGINFGTAAFVAFKSAIRGHRAKFQCIRHFEIDESGIPLVFPTVNERSATISQDDLKSIPGSPVAYWLGDRVFQVLADSDSIGQVCDPRQGLSTGDTDRFIRYWYEVANSSIAFDCGGGAAFDATGATWAPYNKGGEFRKYYGNQDHVVRWESSGQEVKDFTPRSVIRNEPFYFKESLSWCDVTSSHTSFRLYPQGFIFDTVGHSAFFESEDVKMAALGYLNSVFMQKLIPAINPTMHFSGGYFKNLPRLKRLETPKYVDNVKKLVELSAEDSSFSETSWLFQGLSFVNGIHKRGSVAESWSAWSDDSQARVDAYRLAEAENSALACELYGLDPETFGGSPEGQITLLKADRAKDARRLVSFAVGCLMGRYSLDGGGLRYAGHNGVNFPLSRYGAFQPDSDAIVPVTPMKWFEDDLGVALERFMEIVWGRDQLTESMEWLADSLGRKDGDTAADAVRRYLAGGFFKDHAQSYRRRPVYWMFSSGKLGAFQALVYLHRYTEASLARMRSEYVVPLIPRFATRLELLEADMNAASSASERTKLRKKAEALRLMQSELIAFEERLRHYADKRIPIDLDEGVKVNYAKFGELLADSKAITGGSDE